MERLILIAGILISGMATAQTAENKSDVQNVICGNGVQIALNRLGKTKIVSKDGTAKINCMLQEIKQNWVVFVKDKVLHDIMIDKITRIELEDGVTAIYFDDKNKPVIKKLQ